MTNRTSGRSIYTIPHSLPGRKVLGCMHSKGRGAMQRREFITFLGTAAAGWKRAERPITLLREARYLLLGLVSLATVTGLYFWLDVPLVAVAFTYLIVLVLLSLVSNLSSLIVLSFIGVGCLSHFFAPPIYSFRVDYPQDIITISAFVITSFVVSFLVTRARDANQRLEVTNKALRIENVERKRAEQALRESEANFRDYAETASDGFGKSTRTTNLRCLPRMRLVHTPPIESARRAGITLSTLRRNPRSGGLSGQPSIHVNRSVTSYIAPLATMALRCT